MLLINVSNPASLDLDALKENPNPYGKRGTIILKIVRKIDSKLSEDRTYFSQNLRIRSMAIPHSMTITLIYGPSVAFHRLATERSTMGTTDTESCGWNTEPPPTLKSLAVACWDCGCVEIREAATEPTFRLLCISLTPRADREDDRRDTTEDAGASRTSFVSVRKADRTNSWT